MTMLTLQGVAVSPGLARGKAFLYLAEILRKASVDGKEADLSRIDQNERIIAAINDVRQGLETDAHHMSSVLDNDAGDIFKAQSAMIQDKSVISDLKQYLKRGPIDAEEAVRSVFAMLASRFRKSSSESTRARGDDIEDISRRLLQSLRGIYAHRLEGLPSGTVLVARQLYPSDTVFLSRSSTVAVVAEFAGPAAHAALLARELGIPCIGGITGIMHLVNAGDDIIVDGHTGRMLISPDQGAVQAYERSIAVAGKENKDPIAIERSSTMTRNGVEIAVMANARSLEDVELAIQNGANGIGLFRTEPFFMASKHLPSSQEFGDFLTRSLGPVGKMRVNVRLLDIGADKNPIYLPMPSEPDPFLGRRGVRVLLRYPDLLAAQLRALLDTSRRFNIGILIPMVTLESDVIRVVETCRKIAKDMGIHDIPPIGAMIETPAAALGVGLLVKHVEFLSIGSNDLTQYTLAAGRENPLVTEYFLDDHPAVLRLIGLAIADAGSIPISLCGELAGRPAAIPALLRVGLRSLSVASSLLSDVRRSIREATTSADKTEEQQAASV